jgi:hypothetical protein
MSAATELGYFARNFSASEQSLFVSFETMRKVLKTLSLRRIEFELSARL